MPEARSLPDAFAEVMAAPAEARPDLARSIPLAQSDQREQLVKMVEAAAQQTASEDVLSERAIEDRRRAIDSIDPFSARGIEPGAVIAGYTIESVLGQGGMGAVYLAHQSKPSRRVALKLLRNDLHSARVLRRFELESETLGRLRHPGIAQVYEAGLFEGRPYFAMEYVEGLPLTDFARKHALGTREKLRLIARIASAVQHAHSQGVVHRDLKPANILVAEHATNRGEAQPKILDFGVAKVTDSDVQMTTMQTDVGQLIGTISYMSPEQAGGDPASVDARSDVYALGVVAFELLTGKLPHDIHGRMIHEAVRIIRESDPSRLSSVNRTLRGDIETIIGKSLEKDPARRYDSASAFAADIERYLANQPIEARPASTWYQVRKFSRRNRAVVAGVAASFVILLAGLVGTSVFAVRAERARQLEAQAQVEVTQALTAERERAKELQEVVAFQEGQLAEIDAMAMGLSLREGLLTQMGGAQGEEAAERSLNGIDFTGLAMTMLQSNFFEPSRRAIDAQFADQPLVRASLLQSLAQTIDRLGLFEIACEVQDQSRAIMLEHLGPDDQKTLNAANNLGLLLMHQGRYEEAEAILTDTLAREETLFGKDHPETLATCDNMGLLMQEYGRLDEAEPYFRRSLEGHIKLFGEDNPKTLAALNNLGGLYESQAKSEEAAVYFQRALEGSRKRLGNDNERTLSSINNVGVNLKLRGKLDEALPYYLEALEGRRRVFGEGHPKTIRSLNNLGGLYRAMSKLDDAERVYRESLGQYRRTIGSEHPDTIIGMNNLGVVLRDLGRLEESEALGAEAVKASRTTFPPGHWILAAFLSQHASTLVELGRFEQAETEAIEANAIMLGAFGPDHPRTQGTMGLVENLYTKWAETEPSIVPDERIAKWRETLQTGG